MPMSPIADPVDSDAFLRAATPVRRAARDNTRRVADLVRRMTLEEKVGQMTQLTLGAIASGDGEAIRIAPAKLEQAVVKYGVGSVLNVTDQALTVDTWRRLIGQIQAASRTSRLGIPVLYGIDSIHGSNYVRGATLSPQEIGMAATWNPALMQRVSEVSASETRAAGIPWTFSPVLDLGRQPLWPRFYETFGEDPYLATVMGVAYVRGCEGDDIASPDHVATSLKHYVGYGAPLNGRDRTPAWIPENYLTEYFLPPFAAAVRAGARTVMANSAEVNGTPGHVNHHLLTTVLRGDLGFTGFVVSDWEDIKKLVTTWRTAPDEKAATRMAVMAGIDMSMVPSDFRFSDLLIELVREGDVPMSRIDDAVGRILRVKFDLGLFEQPMPVPTRGFATAASRQVALDAARQSLTLLKNDVAVLPLGRGRILVTGPAADSLIPLNNGWTYTWQGDNAALYPLDRPTILKAIQDRAGNRVTYVPGAARDADVAIVCIGEGAYAETPGNITDLTMSAPQLALAEAIEATGTPVVLVLVEGRPRVISRIAGAAKGILLAPNPGNEGGTAVADVLFGDYNPNGKLPFTYPGSPNGLVAYDHKLFETEAAPAGVEAVVPQFEFGSGLSYTTFTYRDLQVSPALVSAHGEVQVSVTVTNSGARAGQCDVIWRGVLRP